MAMMARMRSLAPWFIIGVGGLFVLFMVFSDSSISQLATQGANVVGYIDDEEVTYQEFSAFVERLRNQQVQNTGQEIEPEQMDQFRDQVWETLVNQRIISKKIKDYGITVTDAEIKDALLGPNPPAELTSNFIDSTGQFDRAAYESAILNPANKEIVIQVEEGLRQQLYQQKLQNYLNASVLVSDEEVKQDFIDKNILVNADYAYVNSRFIADSTLQVTDAEIQDYYNQHLDDYKILDQRKLKYVLFRTIPSLQDTIDIEDNLKAIINNLKEDTSTFSTYVEIYSDQPYSLDTITLDKLPEEAYLSLKDAIPGDIVGPLLTPEGFVVYKFVEKITTDKEFARSSHILISSRERTPEAAKSIADSLLIELKKGLDFATAARELSEDPGSGSKGGDLGWFGKGQMVKEFEDASFKGKIGEIQNPVETRYGYHIIKATGRSDKEFVVERIINKIEPSGSTFDRLYNNAGDFAYLAEKNEFESEAELMNYTIVETQPFKEDANVISGLGASKPLVKFSFENGVGSVSTVFKVASGYVVAMISEAIPEGVQSLDKVTEKITRSLLDEKKIDSTYEIVKKIKVEVGDDGNLATATNIFPRVKISNVSNFQLSSSITGVGKDPAFNSYCFSAEINKISDAVKGQRGSYLIKVTSKTKFDSTAFAIQKNSTRSLLLRQKQGTYFTNWLKNVKEEIAIEDLRYKFYR